MRQKKRFWQKRGGAVTPNGRPGRAGGQFGQTQPPVPPLLLAENGHFIFEALTKVYVGKSYLEAQRYKQLYNYIYQYSNTCLNGRQKKNRYL